MKAGTRHALTLDSGVGAAGEASLWIRTLCEQHGVHQNEVQKVDLCSVELVANIVDHAYKSSPGEIRLALTISSSLVRLTIEDDGPPFNPLELASPTMAKNLDDAVIGGWGIHLVRQHADACEYRRRHQSNCITVSFGAISEHARYVDRRKNAGASFPAQRANQPAASTEERSGLDRRSLGYISRTALFRDVPYDKLELILDDCNIRQVSEGDLIVAPGEQNNRVWVVIEGTLQVHFDGPHSKNFLEITEGECVGEISAADGKPPSAWVVAGKHCRLLEIDSSTFLDHLLAIPRVGRNLITTLAERMRRSNQLVSERVRAETELKALQRELDFAQRIQSSMLPANPLFSGESRIDAAGFMRPARQVGGDFYDAVQLDNDRFLVAIGDVCSKGMPAALFMAQTLTLLRSYASRSRNKTHLQLVELANAGNDQLCNMNSEQLFVSVFLAVIDLSLGQLRYVNAGHNPPILSIPGQTPIAIEAPRNPIAGLVPGLIYKAGMLPFPPGSALLLYTDGVTEAENSAGGQLGEGFLYCCMEGIENSDVLAKSIVDRVDHFANGHAQSDDITLLAVRRVA